MRKSILVTVFSPELIFYSSGKVLLCLVRKKEYITLVAFFWLPHWYPIISTHLKIRYPYIKQTPGDWFNKKMPFYQYRKSHCGDKTILQLSYLHNGISYAGKTASLYWIRAPGWGLRRFPPFRYFPNFPTSPKYVSYWIPRSYLTGVAAAQLRWQLSNMNEI